MCVELTFLEAAMCCCTANCAILCVVVFALVMQINRRVMRVDDALSHPCQTRGFLVLSDYVLTLDISQR